VAWLQPIPDTLIDLDHGDPAMVSERRQNTRLALIAAMQLLPARQRAVLILRDVLGWRAAEVAELLDTTTDAVNSALLRSRAHVARFAPAEDEIEEPSALGERSTLERYVEAFHDGDVGGLVSMLRDDVELEMPPMPVWFAGLDAVSRFFGSHLGKPGRWRLVGVRANGQPAAAAYLRDDGGVLRAHSVHVLTVIGGRIRRVSVFVGLGEVAAFGLPDTL
jgi:RNA polymerase sigma-70 factor (ECF subfamily)